MRVHGWKISYEEWESITNLAGDEPVSQAIDYEADGWPWPISGDALARARRNG